MNDSGFGGQRPPGRQINIEDLDFDRIKGMMKWGLVLLGLLFLWMGLTRGRAFYTDWLWFSSVGHESVLLKIVTTRVVLFVVGVAVFLALALPNLYLAHRSTAGFPPQIGAALPPDDYLFVRKLLVRIAVIAIVLMALFLAVQPSAEWETVLLFLDGASFNEADPIFGKDFSFYIFTLPALQMARVWLIAAVVTLMMILAAYYYLTSQIRGEWTSFLGPARTQLAVLGGLVFLLIAAGHWLGRYELLYSPTGAVYGVGYTDNNILIPGRTFLTFVAVVAAGFLIAGGIFTSGYRYLVWPVAGWLVLTVLIGSAAPALVQRFQVEPSELAREREFLASNIAFTRKAFGLEDLQSASHPARGAIEHGTVAENQGTIQNVRLWDESPLLESYNQIQFFRLYYDFVAVHTDRYRVDGELRQVMMATRELSAEKLPAEAQRWVNRQLQFTHGYGVAMSPVTEVEAGGRPSFFIRDVPPTGEIPLERPEIYYGLKSLPYVITRSGMPEFNYPGQEGPVYTSYEGNGGVRLGSFFRRLLYAWQFGDINILISNEIQSESRIQYRRTVPQRFSTISPFLMMDRQAYSVVADGRLFWIQDAYTVTDRYPYSTPWNGRFNYMRNSVKAVIDAYHGTVDYYVFDPDDPLIETYQAIFPDLFRSRDEMPEYLRAHVRVPRDMFTVQTEMLLQYHMQDPVVFYNKEDQWSVPLQTSFGRAEALRPYYIVARLPGEPEEEFLLIQPFTPNNRHNLVGWMAARSDGEHYGELILFRFPTGRHVDGPNQIEARIDNDAVISEQFTLWGQVGSEVSRGILLVIPLGEALLYAEPVFLKPETLEFPELRRIILADARQVVMHRTLDASVAALVGELPAVAPVAEAEAEEPEPEAAGAETEIVEALRQGLQETIERLQRMLDELDRISR